MKNFTLAILIIIVPNLCFAQQTFRLVDSEIVFIEDTLSANSKRYIILSDNWEINYQKSIQYSLTSENSLTLEISTQSDLEQLGLTLLNDNNEVLKIGQQNEDRFFRKTINFESEKNKEYKIVVGSGIRSHDTPFKLLINPTANDYKWRGNKYKSLEINQSQEFKIDSLSNFFEGSFSKILKFAPTKEAKWIRISVKSDNFDPYILGLDKYDNVIKSDYYNYDNATPNIILNTEIDSVKYIVISSSSPLQFNQIDSYGFDINAKTYEINPASSFIVKLQHFITPLNAIIISTIIALLIGYYFHLKSINDKKLYHWEVSDRKILSKKKEFQHPILKGINSLECVSKLNYKFKNLGRKRIKGDHIVEPIILRLTNVEEIIELDHNSIGNNWTPPKIISNNEIQIDFKSIDKNDELEISAVCSISSNEQKENGIISKLNGKISEATIIERTEKSQSLLLLSVMTVNYLTIILLLPLIFIDNIFSLEMPLWWYNFNSIFWPIAVSLLYLHFFFLDRDYFLRAPKIMVSLIKRLFKKRVRKL